MRSYQPAPLREGPRTQYEGKKSPLKVSNNGNDYDIIDQKVET